eukprot:TRINITY_DN77468_c0_g1_i1.p2 TRINITY_DN77468_c0_g1~~TRINITY_DN77468_c0_g1_i1.p2  ORF type:complete len:118 (-),score=47.87 TRINITY_DN77468_c0_g1_i1:59-412(-)
MSYLPPPVSFTDLHFIEEISENLKKIERRRKSLQLEEEGNRERKSSLHLRKTLKQDKKEMLEKKEKVMVDREKELWETGDWREHVKDLNASFSKLPPISREKKRVEGKGESFVVDLF